NARSGLARQPPEVPYVATPSKPKGFDFLPGSARPHTQCGALGGRKAAEAATKRSALRLLVSDRSGHVDDRDGVAQIGPFSAVRRRRLGRVGVALADERAV